jgi:hypothetical protein
MPDSIRHPEAYRQKNWMPGQARHDIVETKIYGSVYTDNLKAMLSIN